MTTEDLHVLEDENGTFTFQCPNCSVKRRAKTPNTNRFRVKCQCGTYVRIVLNARGQYRKEVEIKAMAYKQNPSFEEKREVGRAEVRLRGILDDGVIKFYVVIRDISINGLRCYYNSSRYKLKVGEQITIEYYLKTQARSIRIQDECVVKWVKGDYFGVRCEDLHQYSPESKQKGFFVMPPEIITLELEKELTLDDVSM